jgi:hypothetical protein
LERIGGVRDLLQGVDERLVVEDHPLALLQQLQHPVLRVPHARHHPEQRQRALPTRLSHGVGRDSGALIPSSVDLQGCVGGGVSPLSAPSVCALCLRRKAHTYSGPTTAQLAESPRAPSAHMPPPPPPPLAWRSSSCFLSDAIESTSLSFLSIVCVCVCVRARARVCVNLHPLQHVVNLDTRLLLLDMLWSGCLHAAHVLAHIPSYSQPPSASSPGLQVRLLSPHHVA